MSRIYFHTPSGDTAELKGSERAHLGVLVDQITFGVFDLTGYGNAERLEELLSPDRRLVHGSGQILTWAQHFQTSFKVGLGGELLSYRGRPIESFSLALNTAVVVGNDPIKLAARLHGQCEIHAFIEGPNRAWVADIMQQGFDAGIYRKGIRVQPEPGVSREERRWISQGWESVMELLRARDDEPVVTTYSVTDGFPNQTVAGWTPPVDADLTPDWARENPSEWNELPEAEREDWRQTAASDLWYEVTRDEQWRLGMDGLRASDGGLEIKPDNWGTFRFGHGLSVFDLYAEDWRERLVGALEIERQDA